MKPSPDLGTPCSGQSVNWNWRTVRDWPSWKERGNEMWRSIVLKTCRLRWSESVSDVFSMRIKMLILDRRSYCLCEVIISKRYLKSFFLLYWLRSETLPGNILFFPSNDYCYLTLDQLLWLTWSCNVSTSAIVSHSVGNYIFSLLLSLPDSPLMEINRASVDVASVQDRLNWSYLWLAGMCTRWRAHSHTHSCRQSDVETAWLND